MDNVGKEFKLEREVGKNYSVKVDGKNVVCSQHIFEKLVILRFKEDVSQETFKRIEEQLQAAEDFSRRFIILVPHWVEVLKPIPSSIHEEIRNCPKCGGNLRLMGRDEFECLGCGYNGTRTQKHLSHVMSLSDGGYNS